MTQRNQILILALLALLLAACGRTAVSAPTPSPSPLPPTSTPPPTETAVPPTPTSQFAPPKRRLQPGQLQLAAETDDIPAIFASDDLFVTAAAGSEEWPDEELVIGLALGDAARAYPVRLLSSHEIVNDTVGGQPVAVTWCPLCFSALVFDRVVEGRELTFGVSGYLYNDNLVMYDHQSNTLWSQLVGQALRGAKRGVQLDVLPSLMTSWGEWKARHPDSEILSAARLGQRADEIVDPYAGYYTSGAAGFGSELQNDALPGKALVAGVVAGDAAKAYSLDTVQEEGLINDQVGDLPLLVVYDDALQTALVFRRDVTEQTLVFDRGTESGTVVDRETGTTWNWRSGMAVDGPLAGERLSRWSAPLVFWFAWANIYPETAVYQP